MPKFDVLVVETLENIVTVEAESEADALWEAEDMWKNGSCVLDAENFTGVEFKLMSRENHTSTENRESSCGF